LTCKQFKQPQKGFTLIEVIVAISIFALLGFASYKVVHGLSLARETITKHSEELRRLVNAMNVINRDFSQLSPRKIMDESGKVIPAFYSQGDYTVEFTRIGVPNPLMVKRAKVARIAYRFSKELDAEEFELLENDSSMSTVIGDGKQGYLLRYIWPVLDRGDDKSPKMQVVLVGVKRLELEYMYDKDKWSDKWPPANSGSSSSGDLPYAIKLIIDTSKYGSLERFFQVHELPP
jgi:general secretion pathway protein J